MASECFTMFNSITSARSLFNEGSIICLVLASLLSLLILYSLYADNKKPVSNLKRVPGTQQNVFVSHEEFKEFEDSVDNDGSRPPS
jgi:hypothetical protein